MKNLIIPKIILAGLTAVCLCKGNSEGAALKVVQLSEPRLTGPVSLEQVLASRRSIRSFSSQALSMTQICQLAWAGQGITDKQNGLRTAPSAGAIYPIKLYFATKEGIFIYNPDKHSLEEVSSQDARASLAAAALKQEAAANAPCDIIIAGSATKLAAKYGNKAKRYMLLEAGHVAQNILLQAVSLDLGAVPIGAFDIMNVSRACKLPVSLEPLYIICVGYPAGGAAAEKEWEQKETREMNSKRAKKAVLIVASENFRDKELFETKRALTEAGVETAIASTKTGTLKGMLGGKAEASILIRDVVVDEYDAIIFVGGSGAKEYLNNQVALNIARQAKTKGKVLAAICIAPTVLANAGVLSGIRVTSFPSERGALQKAGAQYTGVAVEQDGFIITGEGPKAASQFGQAIATTLAGK